MENAKDIKIEIRGVGEIAIWGQIKSFSDYEAIKSVSTEQLQSGATSLTYFIYESVTIISSVIGYLIKVINIEAKPVHLFIKEDALISILEDLGLDRAFLVQKF